MRVTNKMADNYNVYNLNNNKGLLDKLNTQMSTKKKYTDPMDAPVIASTSLHFRAELSEIEQYLGKNVTDAISWTDTTQAAIDTGKELMRSLKSEYTSASNGSNRNEDRWTYYNNMVNLVNEFYATGNTTNENRYVFTGARTSDSLTFTDKNFDDRLKSLTEGMTEAEIIARYPDKHVDTYKYAGITEFFDVNDVEDYSFTARSDRTGTNGKSGITLEEIAAVADKDSSGHYTQNLDETLVENVDSYRLRLSYNNLDKTQAPVSYDYRYIDSITGEVKTGSKTTSIELSFVDPDGNPVASPTFTVSTIGADYEINESSLTGNTVYLNTTTGNLIFGENVHKSIMSAMDQGYKATFQYSKSAWEEKDVKPEHYFDCVDISSGTAADKTVVYDDHEQNITYNVGDNQTIKVNANASDVFSLDARRDLNEMKDALTAVEDALDKVNKLKEMREDDLKYSESDLRQIDYLLAAANKEYTYATEKLDKMMSNGITRSQNYFDMVNLAGTDMGTTVKRLTIIRNRLTENQATITAQASDNENIDISTKAVEVNSATLSYSAALQVTGKISQQSLVNFL